MITNNYHICMTGRDDTFVPSLEQVAQLIDFLDYSFYLDGPDRETAAFVRVTSRDTRHWAEYVRQNSDEPVKPLRRRYVHLIYSPLAVDTPYRHYNDLLQLIEGVSPRDGGFVASLGRGTPRLNKIFDCPVPGEPRRWIQNITLHLIRGYHPVWKRVWNEQEERKEWELVAVKGFNLMAVCKLNNRVEPLSLEEYIEMLRLKEEFARFLIKVGQNIGCLDFELLGETSL